MLPQPGDILRSPAVESATATTVLVLPFANLSADKESNALCAGLALDLITDLSRFKVFNIISHYTSELISPEEEHSAPAITILDADYVIRGSFRQAENRIRINTQLINANTSAVLWAENFEGELEDLFNIQDSILLKVVNSIQQQLDQALLSAYQKRASQNINAYTYWLIGMTDLRKGTLEADLSARNHFRKALEIDPAYSRAYSGLSLSYFNEWSCQIWDRWDVSQKGAYKYAKRAIEIDEHDYVAAMVLGRVHLYNGDYDTAEFYLRKSLQLNPNDTDNLVQVATCFVFLGFAEEALTLFNRAVHLNPASNHRYREYGAFIYFELGDFTHALSTVRLTPGKHGWVDMPAYISAAWYMLGDMERSKDYWNMFMDSFIARINNGQPATDKQALDWMIRVNPYKNPSQISRFWNYMMHGEDTREYSAIADTVMKQPLSKDSYRLGELTCTIVYENVEAVLPLSKGLVDIGRLVREPEQQFHCTELMGASIKEPGVEMIDDKARRNYQERILQIQEELAYAEECSNAVAIAKLQGEYDELIDHLSRATGLGGKTRTSTTTIDKIRSAVTWRIRSAIKKIQEVHPSAAKHLSLSIKTGIFCVYSPEKPTEWQS